MKKTTLRLALTKISLRPLTSISLTNVAGGSVGSMQGCSGTCNTCHIQDCTLYCTQRTDCC
jgi:hypothetical protein